MSNCPVCGEFYGSVRGMKTHCGISHSDEKNPFKILCECVECSSTFYKVVSKVQRGEGKYCSKECQDIGQVKESYETCLNCGSKFSDIPYEIDRGRTYCSKKCQGEYESTKVSRICKNCSNEFSVKKSRVDKGRGKYCSYECLEADKFYNSNDIRKSKEYKSWRDDVLIRDNHKCQDCGSDDNIECHHIVPIYECEDMATDVNNGVVLCNSCHADRHRKLEDGVAHLIKARVE